MARILHDSAILLDTPNVPRFNLIFLAVPQVRGCIIFILQVLK